MTPEGVNSFQQLMASMVNRMAEQGLNSPPEERFRVQLETLESMGFVDRQANIQGEMVKISNALAWLTIAYPGAFFLVCIYNWSRSPQNHSVPMLVVLLFINPELLPKKDRLKMVS